MSETAANNKRIAKNTLLLYVRMLFMMGISLYTQRVVLRALGVEDFGIYNVMGGVVAMFAMLSGSLSVAITRFITFELGKGNQERLKTIFSTAVTIQLALGAIIAIVAETVGIWFLYEHMNIPPDRIQAANWVLQFSVITFIINLISVPYNASIVAHEKMSAFAYIGIFEGLGKLAIAFLILASPIDKLVYYAILMMLVALMVRLLYGWYCKRHFEECTYHFTLDTPLLKEMFGFAGWNFLGNGAFILNTQGVNILINMYFGVTVNAARGVALQVDAAVKQFVNNFTMAVNPQITKLYAQGDLASMHQLICRSAKFSAFLMLLFAVPIVLETDTILSIWLGEVPAYASVFLKWLMLSAFMEPILSNPLVTSMFATGKIKRYQITVTIVGGLVFPLSWIAFALGASPQSTYIIFFTVYAVLLFVRLYLLHGMIHLPISMFLRQVIYRLLPVCAISFSTPAILIYFWEPNFVRLVLICVVGSMAVIGSAYCIGLQKAERSFIREKIQRILVRHEK